MARREREGVELPGKTVESLEQLAAQTAVPLEIG
jgi:hypothetical protein